MVLRLFLAAALMLFIAYWYITKGETERPLGTEKKAMKKAEQVEEQILKQAEDQMKEIEKLTQ